jgi:dTDP-4-amino-4,6-dideoxygalactose transaminase
MREKIYLSSPHMSDEGFEKQYIKEAFDTNWIAPLGANVNEFEKELAAKVGIGHAAALSSGTAAIHMALKAAGVGKGDIVFCPTLTFSATANPIIYQNATPVFIDSDFGTWNMSPIALERAFKDHPNVKAVLVVHLYGLSADMDRIVEICKKHQVILIEDAAESLGTTYKGKYTGSFGEYGIFSFNGNKIITTSGGGMLVSNKEERIAKVRFWSTQARDKARHYQHSELGFNYRMSNIVAGIGRGQLKVLDKRVQKKRYIYDFYKRELGKLEGVEFMPINEWNEPNCWLSCVTVSGKVRPIDIMLALEKENIESRPIWKPMHLQPFYQDYEFYSHYDEGDEVNELVAATMEDSCTSNDDENNGKPFSVAESIFKYGVCLPSDTKMTDEDLRSVCNIIKGLWR